MTFAAYQFLAAAAAFMEKYHEASERDELHSCEHGHFDCSTWHGGPCMDEVLSNFPNFHFPEIEEDMTQ